VLGSGRSGTSMVAGTLAEAGWRMAPELHAPRAANPKGFFESPEINGINEELLAPLLPESPALGPGQRWLGVPRPGSVPRADAVLEARMRAVLAERPFCHKDPRFSFTLPAWRPFLPADIGFVCVFRHPALTVRSMLEECRTAPYLAGLELDEEHALELWVRSYRSILAESCSGAWHFVHYDQMLSAAGVERLSSFLGAPIRDSFPDAALHRPQPEGELPSDVAELYETLCTAAGHRGAAAHAGADVATPAAPLVTVLARAGDDRSQVERMAADVAAQRGVGTELVVIGHDGASSWPEALARVDTELVALLDPACRPLPSWLGRSAAALTAAPSKELATCDSWLTDAHEQFVERVRAAEPGAEPGPFWNGALVLRRSALPSAHDIASRANELAWLRRLEARGAVVHVDEPGFSVPRERFDAEWAAPGRTRVLAWPEYTEPALEALLRDHGDVLAGRSDVELCLYFDAATDGERDEALARLERAHARVLGAQTPLEVRLVEGPHDDRGWRELARIVDLRLRLGPERGARAAQRALPVPIVDAPSALERLLGPPSSADSDSREPEPTPTHEEHPPMNEVSVPSADESPGSGLEREIARLGPWFYPVEIGGTRVTPGLGSVCEPEWLENRTRCRRTLLVDGVLERVSFEGQRVLDLACNCGYWSSHYARAGARSVFGMEGRPEHLAQARFYWRLGGFLPREHWRFELGNVADEDDWTRIRARGPFDVTLCAGILYHVPNYAEILAWAAEVTRDTLIVDTRVVDGPEQLVREPGDLRFNAIAATLDKVVPNERRLLAVLRELGFEPEVLPVGFGTELGVSDVDDYAAGARVTVVARKVPAPLPAARVGAGIGSESPATA